MEQKHLLISHISQNQISENSITKSNHVKSAKGLSPSAPKKGFQIRFCLVRDAPVFLDLMYACTHYSDPKQTFVSLLTSLALGQIYIYCI